MSKDAMAQIIAMTSALVSTIVDMSTVSLAVGATLACIGFIDYNYCYEHRQIAIQKASIGFTMASIVLTAASVYLHLKGR